MKKLTLMTLLIVLISSCKDFKCEELSSKYAMNCENIGYLSYRCENHEVICYKNLDNSTRSGGGLSCYFKNSVKIKDTLNEISNNDDLSN